ncbi:unknown [Odoribacter sp. CAG:788]|mgnify:FL=1|nr:unknown [Odoribacter sp. CAG:788]
MNRIGRLEYSRLSPVVFLAFCRRTEAVIMDARVMVTLLEVVVFRNALQTYGDSVLLISSVEAGEWSGDKFVALRERVYGSARRTLEAALQLLCSKLQSFSGVLAEADTALSDIGEWSDYYAEQVVKEHGLINGD